MELISGKVKCGLLVRVGNLVGSSSFLGELVFGRT